MTTRAWAAPADERLCRWIFRVTDARFVYGVADIDAQVWARRCGGVGFRQVDRVVGEATREGATKPSHGLAGCVLAEGTREPTGRSKPFLRMHECDGTLDSYRRHLARACVVALRAGIGCRSQALVAHAHGHAGHTDPNDRRYPEVAARSADYHDRTLY